MATMDDIARRLGVSKGTVSKALSGAADVSETMRKSVVETAVEIGYSRIARSASGKRLCVFVNNMSYEKPDDFGWDIITGFRKMAEPTDYQVGIIPFNEQMQKESRYDEFMLRHNYLGAVFLGLTLLDPWMKDFQVCTTPAVLYDNHVQSNPAVTHLGIDNDEGMEMAVARLVELGHRKIGYLSSALGSYVYQARYASFFHALRQFKLDAHQYMAGYAYRSSDCLAKHLPRLLDKGCTAIICSHDLLAHTLLIHCAELGLRVPEDLSVVGIDDLPLCRYTSPPLTTIRQDRTQLGKSAFYALSSLIDHVPISTLLLHAELIERASTGPAPATEAPAGI